MLLPLLAKLQPPLTPLLKLLPKLLLPSNSGSRKEKPAFGPVFFRLYVASIDKIIENSTPFEVFSKKGQVRIWPKPCNDKHYGYFA